MLWSSWHNHTGTGQRFSYCADQEMTPACYRRALADGPWACFAITDHAFSLALPDEISWPCHWYHQPERLWAHRAFREDKTARYLEQLAAVCDGERIFSGMEVEVAYDGSLSMDPALRPCLDVVVGSIHHLSGNKTEWVAAQFTQLALLLRHPIDILGHPFRHLATAGPVADEVIEETLLRARAAEVAIEVNAHIPFARDAHVVARAAALGVPIAFGVDAHHPSELALHSYFARVVRESGVAMSAIPLFQPRERKPMLAAY